MGKALLSALMRRPCEPSEHRWEGYYHHLPSSFPEATWVETGAHESRLFRRDLLERQ